MIQKQIKDFLCNNMKVYIVDKISPTTSSIPGWKFHYEVYNYEVSGKELFSKTPFTGCLGDYTGDEANRCIIIPAEINKQLKESAETHERVYTPIKDYASRMILYVSAVKGKKAAIKCSKLRITVSVNGIISVKEDSAVILNLTEPSCAYKRNKIGKMHPCAPVDVLKLSDKDIPVLWDNAKNLPEFFSSPELETFNRYSGIIKILTGMQLTTSYETAAILRLENIFRQYLLLMVEYPQLETISKMGMQHIMQSAIKNSLNTAYVSQIKEKLQNIGKFIDRNTREGKKALKLPKYIMEHLNYTKAEVEEYIAWTDIYSLTQISEQDFIELLEKGYLMELILKNHSSVVNDFYNKLLSVLKYGYNLKKLAKYLRKQNESLQTLYDYLTISEFCGVQYDMYPQDLKKQHDELRQHKKDMENAENNSRLKVLADQINAVLKEEEADNQTLCVKIPESIEDFINEGNAQSNCVGNYYNNTLNGYSITFFIRKVTDPDDSYITAEFNVRNGALNQIYYACNVPVTSASERIFGQKICGILKKGIAAGKIDLKGGKKCQLTA